MHATFVLPHVALALALFSTLGCAMARAGSLGATNGQLAPCPSSPNCVCTQATDEGHAIAPIPFTGPAEAQIPRIRRLLEQQPRVKVTTVQPLYLAAEFRSAIFRFVDDVEFVVNEKAQRIEFRSASRIGHSDLGVNRKRMEKLRAGLASLR